MAGSALREIFARFGIEFDREGALTRGDQAVGSLTSRLQSFGQAIAGAGIVVGVRAFADETSRMGAQISAASQTLGLSTEEFQSWRASAAQAGVNSEQFGASMSALQRQIFAARTGSQGAAAMFRRLGVSIRGAHGATRPTAAILNDLADGIARTEDPTRRAALAMGLFGEAGGRLVPVLARGSEGARESLERFRALGGGMSSEAIEASEDLRAAYADLDLVMLSLRSRIAVWVLPAVQALTEGSTRLGQGFFYASENGRLAEAAVIALGAAAVLAGGRAALAWVAAAAPFVGLAVVIAAAILVVEDLIVAFEGGESVIGDLSDVVDEWARGMSDTLQPARDAWLFLSGIINSTVQAVSDFLGLGVDLTGGDGDAAIDQTDTSAQGRLTDAVVRQRRAGLGAGEAFLPDVTERALAAREASRMLAAGTDTSDLLARFGNVRGLAPRQAAAASGPPQVTIENIDASGLTTTQATAVVESAMQRAFARRDTALVDDLGQEGAP